MNPSTLVVVCGLSAAALFIPRKKVYIPLLLSACFLAVEDGIDIAGMYFPGYRLVLIAALIRILVRREITFKDHTGILRIIVIWAIYSLFAYTVLYGSFSAFIMQGRKALDAIGLFLIFHSTVKDIDDVHDILAFYTLLVIPIALAMLYESRTGVSVFSILGDAPKLSSFRGEDVRAQGPFRHAILAGAFGATSMSIIVSCFWNPKIPKWRVVGGLMAATAITITSHSSGGLIVYVVCLAGLSIWKYRTNMRLFRWMVVAILGFLIVIMNAPIWFIFARLSGIFGGTGWHRAELLNGAFGRYFSEWWLIGTTYTRHWMPYGVPSSPSHSDITNQFLAVGVDGGFLSMLLFIWIIVLSFKRVGYALAKAGDSLETRTIWALGVSLAGHTAAFMSVPYFDQIVVHWYLLLAMINVAVPHINSIKKVENKIIIR